MNTRKAWGRVISACIIELRSRLFIVRLQRHGLTEKRLKVPLVVVDNNLCWDHQSDQEQRKPNFVCSAFLNWANPSNSKTINIFADFKAWSKALPVDYTDILHSLTGGRPQTFFWSENPTILSYCRSALVFYAELWMSHSRFRTRVSCIFERSTLILSTVVKRLFLSPHDGDWSADGQLLRGAQADHRLPAGGRRAQEGTGGRTV